MATLLFSEGVYVDLLVRREPLLKRLSGKGFERVGKQTAEVVAAGLTFSIIIKIVKRERPYYSLGICSL